MSDDTPDTGTPETSEPETTEPEVDLAAEVEKWKAQARKHEDRAKANAQAAKELDQLRQQSMTEQERAVEQARAEARAAAMTEFGGKLVDAAIRVAAANRLEETSVAVLLQGLDRRAFLTEEGEVDEESVRRFVDGIAPAPQETPQPPGFPDLGQGARRQDTPLGSDPLLRDLKQTLGIR